jgi:tetratricopeptide (TPR) repeat protein
MRPKFSALPLFLGAILLLFWTATATASEQARPFLSALEAYKAGDYPGAIAQFKSIVQGGVVNGRLYYNLGNAYLKNSELGPAILWYERALELMPSDPDLRFNLEYARSLTKDVPEESGSPLARILFFWNYQLGARDVKMVAIGLNLLVWLSIALWRSTRRRGPARTALVAAFPALVFALTALFNYAMAARFQPAVVLFEQVAVRAGLEESATELFVLHAGAKVRVVKQLKDHFQIRFSDDKLGWVPKDRIGIIPG